jgi:hypothetical protein
MLPTNFGSFDQGQVVSEEKILEIDLPETRIAYCGHDCS